jgi:microsomal dipeptidase-like Zn-dependent dipeptidase
MKTLCGCAAAAAAFNTLLFACAVAQPPGRVFGIPPAPIMIPAPAPPGVTVNGTPAVAHVRWQPVAGATGYSVSRWKQTDPDCCRAQSGMLPASATAWDDLIQSGGTWVYLVTASYANGTQLSTTVDYVYAEPQIPAGFTARQTGPGTVVLSWQAVPGASYYTLGGPPTQVSANVSGTTATITGVPSGRQTWNLATVYDPDGVHRAGSKFTQASTDVAIRGFADLHNHQFANLGFGGRGFVGMPFGPLDATLPWCTSSHGPGGTGDLLGNAVKAIYGNGLLGHHVGGFPEFDGWPRWDSVTHQSVHEDWLLRAHRGGLQLLVMLAVNNEFFCGLADKASGRACGDTEAIQYQLDGARRMEAYIDAKNGGAGRGWYRIVQTPAEARRAIDSGQLAVVLGIEVDKLVCDGAGPCTTGNILDTIDEMYQKGVRHVFPIHFQDNAIGGASFDKTMDGSPDALDPTVLIAIGGTELVKPYQFHTRNCAADGYQFSYGRCNTQGLTTLGTSAIRAFMNRGVIIDTDHMSELAANQTLDLAEAASYPVVSGHTGFVEISQGSKANEGNLSAARVERIRKGGGMVGVIPNQGKLDEIRTWAGPGQTVVKHECGNSSETVAQAYLYAVSKMQGGPVAFGTDMNGFAGLPGPRHGPDACPGGKAANASTPSRVAYPFTALANGASMDRSVVGQKTFDINTDSIAHVGMLPDLVAEFQNLGISAAELEPLMRSAEGYIAMWERAIAHAPPPLENPECPGVRRGLRGTSSALAKFQSETGRRQIECQAGTGAYSGQGGRKPNDCISPDERAAYAEKVGVYEARIADLEGRKVQLACFK